jgi:hypothetical protein
VRAQSVMNHEEMSREGREESEGLRRERLKETACECAPRTGIGMMINFEMM